MLVVVLPHSGHIPSRLQILTVLRGSSPALGGGLGEIDLNDGLLSFVSFAFWEPDRDGCVVESLLDGRSSEVPAPLTNRKLTE